jgi:Flp pilus assembly protein TadD
METRQNRWLIRVAVPSCALLIFLISINQSSAEVRTISAIGEYRMGDNDTRTDAKRLALLDAKRLALEQTGTYIEGITQIKNFDLTKEEIRAYTAGIVEVIEEATQTLMEGDTTVVRVNITVKIDPDVVREQIDSLRKNEEAKAGLLRLRVDRDRLMLQVEDQSQQLAALRSKAKMDAISKRRQQILTGLDVEELLARARVALSGSERSPLVSGRSTPSGRSNAMKLVEMALALDPSHSEGHNLKGVLLTEAGQHNDAITEFRIAIGLQPDDAPTHNNLAHALIAVGKRTEAISEYSSAIQLNPTEIGYHNNLGRVLAEIGHWEGVIEQYSIVLVLRPDDTNAHVMTGIALQETGDIGGALAEFRKALQFEPRNPTTHGLIGDLLQEAGDFKNAIKEYRIALELDPSNAKHHYHFGRALSSSGAKDQAIAEYRIAIDLQPDYAPVHLNLGALLATSSDSVGAITALKKAVTLRPQDAESHFVLGNVYMTHEMWTDAAQELRSYLALTPNTPQNQKDVDRVDRAKVWLDQLERIKRS